MVKPLLTSSIMLLLLTYSGLAQEPDSTELQQFWQKCVVPFIERDFDALKSIIDFPMPYADWRGLEGQGEPGYSETAESFFRNFDTIFNEDFRTRLGAKSWRDVDIMVHDYDKVVELITGVGWKIEDCETAVLLRYKNIRGVWKLCTIQGVG